MYYFNLSFRAKGNSEERKHSSEERAGCSLCTQKYGNISKLKRDLLIHTGESSCICSQCAKHCEHSEEFQEYSKTYSCPRCTRSFSQTSDLQKHRSGPTCVKSYRCTQCQDLFAQAYTLDRHVKRVHNNDKQFSCTRCTKTFSEAGMLGRHLMAHDIPSNESGPHVCC